MRQQTIGHGTQQLKADTPCPPIELDCIPATQSFADPDSALVEALKARTAVAFDDLVKRYGRRLLMVAMKITKNKEDAEDVVQESFLRIFRKIGSFRGDSKFATWLIQIAINQALMMIRGSTRSFVSIDECTVIGDRAQWPEITDDCYTPEQLCAQRELEEVLLNLTNVRKSSRRVMELRVKHFLSEIEIAQLLNLTLSAVKARLHRGRMDLREAMSRSFGSAKLAQTCKNMSTSNGKREQWRGFTGASALASDNLLPASSIQSSSKFQSCASYRFVPQILRRPRALHMGGQEIAL